MLVQDKYLQETKAACLYKQQSIAKLKQNIKRIF